MENRLSSILYIAIDGDDVGRRLEFLTLTNQVEDLSTFSRQFQGAFDQLVANLSAVLNARVVFSGGDNLLAIVEPIDDLRTKLEVLKQGFFEGSTCTLSIGLGATSSEAYLALRLAKASGKDQVCLFSEVFNV